MTRLKSLRLGRGLSQEALAYKAGLSFTTVNKIENGHAAYESTLRKLARALGAPQSEWQQLTKAV